MGTSRTPGHSRTTPTLKPERAGYDEGTLDAVLDGVPQLKPVSHLPLKVLAGRTRHEACVLKMSAVMPPDHHLDVAQAAGMLVVGHGASNEAP
jgi:hypothetical protein